MERGAARLPRSVREALAGELVGATVRVTRAPGLHSLPLEGEIVDETLGTFLIRVPGTGRKRRVPKSGLVGTIYLANRELPLNGELLRMRPEDRTKRLLWGGRRRDK
jgi:RNase P/RNase MRP subunit p29